MRFCFAKKYEVLDEAIRRLKAAPNRPSLDGRDRMPEASREGGPVAQSLPLIPSRRERERLIGSSCEQRWEFWIDRGGTFTDIVARAPDGALTTRKLLSEDPEHYEDAAIEGMRQSARRATAQPLPAERIGAIKMGTTVATNALLERKGEPTLLAITKGFADALRIGTQNRPKIFARKIVLPEPLYADVVEIDERLDARWQCREAARRGSGARCAGAICDARDQIHRHRADALAIALPTHEERVAEIARELGFTQVTASHDASR